MAANAIGTNQHQRADRIANGLESLGGGQLNAIGLRLHRDLLLDAPLGRVLPVAGQRLDQFAIDLVRPVAALPGRASRLRDDVFLALLQPGEKRPPIGRHRTGIFLKPGVEILDIGGIDTVKEG
jgi:hypothetical protein